MRVFIDCIANNTTIANKVIVDLPEGEPLDKMGNDLTMDLAKQETLQKCRLSYKAYVRINGLFYLLTEVEE